MTARREADRCITLLVVQALAVDVSLAALLGEGLYNFGELLLHPIVSSSPNSFPCVDNIPLSNQYCVRSAPGDDFID